MKVSLTKAILKVLEEWFSNIQFSKECFSKINQMDMDVKFMIVELSKKDSLKIMSWAVKEWESDQTAL